MKSRNNIEWASYSSKKALHITAIYLVISIIWIFGSDKLVITYFSDKYMIGLISMIKGWVFVICTSAVIYFLVRNAISAIQKQREHLELNEAKLKYLFDWASNGIFLMNKNGDFIDVNQKGCQMLGFNRNEILKKNLKDVLLDETHSAAWNYEDLMKDSTTIKEYLMTTKDNTILNVEVSAQMMPDGNFQAIIRDITERKKYEEQLLASEGRFSTVFKASPAGIVLINLTSLTCYDVNDAFLNFSGYSKEEVIGKSAYNLNLFINKDQYEHIIKSAKGEGQIFDYEIDFLNADGNACFAIISLKTIKLQKQGFILMLVRDITERKRFEEEIKKSGERYRSLSGHLQTIREQERATIAREMHDELGQILTTLKMNLSLMRREIEDKRKLISYSDILKEIASMNEMIDKAVGRVRKLITQLRPELLDKLGLIAALEWFIQEFKTNSKIECTFNATSEELNLGKEKELPIFRIVQEALINVAKHSGADKASVSLSKDNSNITLEITDNGKGITDEDMMHDNSFGILGIRERALLVNGVLEISGEPNKGTKIRVVISN